jgi:8-amino-7-oxononanoate synthase
LRARLAEHAIAVVENSFGPVVALLVGASAHSLALAAALRDAGLLAQAIRAPTVPEGRARIRITVTAAATDDEVEHLGEVVKRCWDQVCRG